MPGRHEVCLRGIARGAYNAPGRLPSLQRRSRLAAIVLGVGYVGSALVRALLARGEHVVALDNLFSTDEAVVVGLGQAPAYRFIRGSVADPAALESAFRAASGPATVFNLAAQASASPEAASPEYVEETNLRGPRLVLEAMRRFGARTLVYGSSLRVYGDSLPDDADEYTPYGRFSDLSHLSKVYVEKLMEMYAARDALRCLSVRLGLVYGPAPVMKTDYRFMTAPNKFCLQAVRGEELVVWGDSRVGLIHVADAASALLAAAEHPGFAGYVPANAATELATIADVARLVAEEGRRRGLEVRIRLPGESPHPSPLPGGEGEGLPSRLTATSFQPTHDLRRGVAETLEHFLMNRRSGVPLWPASC